jgi:hypothetical protein
MEVPRAEGHGIEQHDVITDRLGLRWGLGRLVDRANIVHRSYGQPDQARAVLQ